MSLCRCSVISILCPQQSRIMKAETYTRHVVRRRSWLQNIHAKFVSSNGREESSAEISIIALRWWQQKTFAKECVVTLRMNKDAPISKGCCSVGNDSLCQSLFLRSRVINAAINVYFWWSWSVSINHWVGLCRWIFTMIAEWTTSCLTYHLL